MQIAASSGPQTKETPEFAFSSLHHSSPGCLTASKCLLWNFNVHRPLRAIKGPQVYMQKQEFQQPAVLQPYLMPVSKPPFPLRLRDRPALHPGNVMSAHDLSSIQCCTSGARQWEQLLVFLRNQIWLRNLHIYFLT